MLGKLIGYETKAFGRIMLPLYGAALAFALFTGLSLRFMPEDTMSGLPGVLIFMIYTVLLLAIIIMTCVLSVTRFYKNLLGAEGYLMFSLPASTAEHIVSKVISVLIWTALSSAVSLLSFILTALGAGGLEPFRDFFEIFKHPELMERLPSAIGVTSLILLMIIAGTAASIVRIYAGISIGHQFNDHRILFSIVALIAFNFIGTILTSILSATGNHFGLFNFISKVFEADTLAGVYAALAGAIVFMLIQVLFFGAMTWFLLDRKLNLE